MKTIGILGGMSFESTLEYYRIINEEINKSLGSLHSAKILLESYDFFEIETLQSEGKWDKLAQILSNSAQKLEKMGADYIAIATNTMHIVAPEVQNAINIPLIHIADAAANAIKSKNIDTVALFGTTYTMTKPFYIDKLRQNNIKVIIPEDIEKEIINTIIFDELCKGIIKDSSRDKLNTIINNCKNQGAKAVILGCTELPLIIKEASIELIDTTLTHCKQIVTSIQSL